MHAQTKTVEKINSDVVVVDSSAEIGGAGRVPDPCIGLARRMQIPHDLTQARAA